jgi:hypothetical protein
MPMSLNISRQMLHLLINRAFRRMGFEPTLLTVCSRATAESGAYRQQLKKNLVPLFLQKEFGGYLLFTM